MVLPIYSGILFRNSSAMTDYPGYESCKSTHLNLALKNFVEQVPYSHQLCPPDLNQEIFSGDFWSVSMKPEAPVLGFEYCALLDRINSRAFIDCFRKFAHQLSDYILMDNMDFRTHGLHKNLHQVFLYSQHHALSDPDRGIISRTYLQRSSSYIHSVVDQLKDLCKEGDGFFVQRAGYSVMARLYVELRLFADEVKAHTTLKESRTLQATCKNLQDFLAVEKFCFSLKFKHQFGTGQETKNLLEKTNGHLCSLLNLLRSFLNKAAIDESATYCILAALLRNHGYTEFSFFTPGMDRYSFEDYTGSYLETVLLTFLSTVRNGIFGFNLQNVSHWLLFEICDAVCLHLSSVVKSQRQCDFEALRLSTDSPAVTAASAIEKVEERASQYR